MTGRQRELLLGRGTEPPFTGEFVNHFDDGTYACAGCENPLFSSETKFESTTPGLIGWPAFSDVVASSNILVREDLSYGMRRLEILCRRCGGHLGHYFDDEASPNGKHYCVNSGCLTFMPVAVEPAE